MKHRHEALLIEIMAECSDMLLAGASVASCLERFPKHAADIEPLLATTAHVRALRDVPPRAPETMEHSRAMFIRAATQLAAERSRPTAPTIIQHLRTEWQQILAGLAEVLSSSTGPRAMPVGLAALLIVIILGGLLATGAVTASARALPGDLLYPVKITAENVAFFMTRDTVQRETLRQQFSERRLAEIQVVVTQGRTVYRMPVSGTIEAFAPDSWQIAGLTIEITPQTQIEGTPQIGSAVEGVVHAPGDGGLLAIYLEVVTPAPPSPTPTVAPPTPRPTPTVIPTWTPTATTPPPFDSEQAVLDLPRQAFFEPTDAPTASPTFTPTTTPTSTLTPRPTATFTTTATPSPVPAMNKGRVVGWVNSIEPTYWLIDGNRIETTGSTIIEGNPGVGWRVEAEVERLPGDRYIGLRIVALAGPDYVERFNAIEDVYARGGDLWQIGNFQVHVTSNTAIEGDPQIGDTVEVNGERRRNGEIWALRIATVRSHRYEFLGELQAISDSLWMVDGTAVHVTAQTQIIGNPGVGDWIGVRASTDSRNEFWALLIYVAPR